MAGSGVNVKMGVTGVAQFKSSINQAKQNMKTLDAQLALTEKQYKATGDSETYMQQKTEQLQAKLAEQKSVAENAQRALSEMTEKGVDKGSKAFQDMLRTLVQVKGDILDTESAMSGIATSADEAGNEVDTMNYALKDIGKDVKYQNVTDALTRITDGMQGVINKAISVGKAIVKEVLGAGSWADDLATRATYFGISPEELQQMEKTATLIDTPVEAIINARKRLKKETAGRSKETMGAFAALGVDPDDAKNAEDLFWRTGEALMKLGNEYDQEAYAQKLFGRSWNELIPLFEAGRKAYENLNESWTVVPEESIKSLTDMDDQYQILTQEFESLKYMFLSELAPAMTTVMGTLTDLLKEFNAYLQTDDGKEMMEALANAVKSLFDDLTNVDPKDVMSTIQSTLDSITSGLKWISENKNAVVTAVEAFIGAWALLEGAKGVSTALLLFNGLKGLGSGKAAAAAASGGAGAAATGGGAWATMKGIFTTGGGLSMLTPAAILALGLTPAILANNYDRNNAAAKQASRVMNAQNLAADDSWFLEASANALGIQEDGRWGNFAEIEALLMGMNSRSDLEKSILHNMLQGSTANGNYTWDELQRLWSGDAMDMGQMTAILESVTDAYDRMAQEAEANQEASDKVSGAGDKIEDAAKDMSKLPGLTAEAVRNGLNGTAVYIDGNAITGIVGELMAQYVNNQ